MALQTSPEQPASVRVVSQAIGGWVDRLGPIWLEGQLAQLNARPGTQTAFLTVRDSVANLSLQVTCPRDLLTAMQPPLAAGSRVVLHAKPSWYYTRGTLSLVADEIRPVGVGELLARIERLRALLEAEGLFAPQRKRALPFLPRTVGLVCGRSSAAERDVVDNARRRWPGLPFRVEAAAVQGPSAASQVIDAVRTLDRDPQVDVVVIARGGGSVEDLLPFSDEALLREVALTRTPVVSAIGHEDDRPLLDLVADVRASTPTDAAKRVVPDLAEQRDGLEAARLRLRTAVRGWLGREADRLAAVRSRPVMAGPRSLVAERVEEVETLRHRAHRSVSHRVDRAHDDLVHVRARVRALSPAATLARGYALVQTPDGTVVTAAADVAAGDPLQLRLADGELTVHVDAATPGASDAG